MGYPGGKSGPGVYHRLINLMPPHQTYIEPFLGGGAIMRLKRPARYNIGIDLDSRVIEAWADPIGKSAFSRSTIGEIPDSAGSAGRRAVARVLVIPPQFRFLHGDALTFLSSYAFGTNDLVYCDPPYLMTTRSSGPRYRHEFSDEQHHELLTILEKLPCRVMISGYWSNLYNDQLRGWEKICFQAMTRGGMRTEWVWFNYPPPTALHDYRFLGETAHKRQDLKRQIASWTRKLTAMPLLKKQALLSAIAGIGETAFGPPLADVPPLASIGGLAAGRPSVDLPLMPGGNRRT